MPENNNQADTSEGVLNIFLLGRFNLLLAGKSLSVDKLPGRKSGALLKLLALQDHNQLARDQAMDLLWPDLSSSSASAQLYKAIHHIRHSFSTCLGDTPAGSWIELSKNTVRLTAPEGVITDTSEFEAAARSGLRTHNVQLLERAALHYQGILLPSDLYAEWSEAPRAHYRQLHLDVLLSLADGYQHRGDQSAAAESWRLVLEIDASIEAAHRGLMTVYAEQGHSHRAIRQYEACEAVLQDLIGSVPADQTRSLNEQVRSGQLVHRNGEDRQHALQDLSVLPLVGRDEELDRIRAQLDALDMSQGRVLLIRGEAGMGKTRLVQELVTLAHRREFRCHLSSASEMDGQLAYGPFLNILYSTVQDDISDSELLPEELSHALPNLTSRTGAVPNADRRAAQGYLFSAIGEFLIKRSQRSPLVLVVENIHSADQDTWALFRFLARQLANHPVLLVATARIDSSRMVRDIDRLAHELSQGQTATTLLDLNPLTADAHKSLLACLSADQPGASGMSEEIFQLSEGNPLFALELARFRAKRDNRSDGSIPCTLQTTVLTQLELISAEAGKLLSIASAAGLEVTYALLERLWSGTADELLDVLDEITQAQLMQEHGADFRFRHALFRVVIYESVSQARCRHIHANIARVLVETHCDSDALPVEKIAWHYQQAKDSRQAAYYLQLSGDRAEDVYAHRDALSYYQRALDLLLPATDATTKRLCSELYARRGEVSRSAGYLNDSLAAYQQALALIEDLPVVESEKTELHRQIALVSIFTGDMKGAGQHIAAAWEFVSDDPRFYARLHCLRALHLWHFNRLEEAIEYACRAHDLAEEAGAATEAAQACEILAMSYLPLGQWQQGMKYEQKRLQQGRWSPDIVVATDAHLCLWEYHMNDDAMLLEATQFIQDVSDDADRLGDTRCVAICKYALGTIKLWQGETLDAQMNLDKSLQLHKEVGSPAGMAYTLARRAVLHTAEGATDLGWAAVKKGMAYADQAAIRDHCLQRLYGVAIWNRMEAGDRGEVVTLVELSENLLETSRPCTACSVDLYPWLAMYYLQQGEVEKAATCAEQLKTLAAKTGHPVSEATASIVQCGVEQSRGERVLADQFRDLAIEQIRATVFKGVASPITHMLDRMTV
ncbi:MAG: AAA family ATPase [Candidatus Thiodiazotropha sp. (ex Cardiolucina cf. quadrata)]|nr:AAA family ATPase [Candidatus Thiodiazotropha sp. (ex Cardiolucina cf. quadrata)]